MHSFGSVFLMTFMIIDKISLKEDLKYRICRQSSMKIDSAVVPFGTRFLYMISDEMVYKLEIKSDTQSVIVFEKRLNDWSSDIKSPITMIYVKKGRIEYFDLINCIEGRMWSVRYEYNKLEGSAVRVDCLHDIESILEPNSGLHYIITEWRAEVGNSYTLQLREGEYAKEVWLLKTGLEDENKIKLVDEKNSEEVQKTKDYRGLKGNGISSAFLYNKYWYLFGGRYYCRILLRNVTFEECNPIPFTDWIKDCEIKATKAPKVPQQSNQSENKDISLYIIISVVVVILAVIVVVVIVFFIIQAVRSKKSVQTLS